MQEKRYKAHWHGAGNCKKSSEIGGVANDVSSVNAVYKTFFEFPHRKTEKLASYYLATRGNIQAAVILHDGSISVSGIHWHTIVCSERCNLSLFPISGAHLTGEDCMHVTFVCQHTYGH